MVPNKFALVFLQAISIYQQPLMFFVCAFFNFSITISVSAQKVVWHFAKIIRQNNEAPRPENQLAMSTLHFPGLGFPFLPFAPAPFYTLSPSPLLKATTSNDLINPFYVLVLAPPSFDSNRLDGNASGVCLW